MGGNTFPKPLPDYWKCPGCSGVIESPPRIWHAACLQKHKEVVVEDDDKGGEIR
jgi:hypothetical protein